MISPKWYKVSDKCRKTFSKCLLHVGVWVLNKYVICVYIHMHTQNSKHSFLNNFNWENSLKWNFEFEKLMEKLVMSFVNWKMWQNSEACENFS